MRDLAVISVSKPLRQCEAMRWIRKVLLNGDVEFTYHCSNRMTERHIDMLDVEYALYSGMILRNPVWDAKHENWKYRVQGTDIEGDSLTVIVVIDEVEFLLRLVTVF